jgi:hypothetical protein
MLLRLTVSLGEIIVTTKVALRRGSSQQGKARLAAVGWCRSVSTRTTSDTDTHFELSQCIVLLRPLVLKRALVVSHHRTSEFSREGNGQCCLRPSGQRGRKGKHTAFCLVIKRSGGIDLLQLEGIGIQRCVIQLQIGCVEDDGRCFLLDIEPDEIGQLSLSCQISLVCRHTRSSPHPRTSSSPGPS